MATSSARTVFGWRWWPTPVLKPLLPFMMSGSLAYFLFSFVHTKMMDDPFDKWNQQLIQVKKDQVKEKERAKAIVWYEEQIAKGTVPESEFIQRVDAERKAKESGKK